jgi:hypothetical protein
MGGEDYSHPAYGHISASRVSGHMNLHGSEFHHHGYIIIKIAHGRFTRSLSRDWHYEGEHIVDVALSEAQWAHFVSSLNHGGTPCTIDALNRKYVARLPDPPSRQEQFDSELKDTMKRSQETLNALIAKIKEMKISQKAKDDLIRDINMAQTHISSNAKYVAESFSEHMEETTEKAKCEVNAYITSQIHRAGLDHLQAQILVIKDEPKLIEEKE